MKIYLSFEFDFLFRSTGRLELLCCDELVLLYNEDLIWLERLRDDSAVITEADTGREK